MRTWMFLLGFLAVSTQAESVKLLQDRHQAVIDTTTGRVTAFGRTGSEQYFSNTDLYRFGGRESDETFDLMTVRQQNSNTLVLEGENRKIGLLMRTDKNSFFQDGFRRTATI